MSCRCPVALSREIVVDDRPDTGHDLAFRQMPMTHHPRMSLRRRVIGNLGTYGAQLRLKRLFDQPACTRPDKIGQRIRRQS